MPSNKMLMLRFMPKGFSKHLASWFPSVKLASLPTAFSTRLSRLRMAFCKGRISHLRRHSLSWSNPGMCFRYGGIPFNPLFRLA